MIQHGSPPFLECSSQGDKRFSALYARVRAYGGRTIEDVYQAAKIFDDGTTGLNWRQAKGRVAVNAAECAALYATLWDTYIAENPHLLPVLTAASGLSDIFGQKGRQCQATELWRIRERTIAHAQNHNLALDQPQPASHQAAPQPRVLNKHAHGIPAGSVYIGRPSKWGNPFQIGRDGSRDDVVDKYRAYILAKPELLGQLPELRGKDLVCFCAPARCHGDVLRELANSPRPTFTRARSSPEQQQDNEHEMD